MGTDRAGRGRSIVGASLVGALGCGPTVSLDEPEPAASSSGAMSDSGSSTRGSSDGPGSTSDAPEPDLPPERSPAPLPGECLPGCTVDLPLTWTWEEPTRPPGDGDPPPEHWLSAHVAPHDGGWVVAHQRDRRAWLTRVDPEGGLEWSMPLAWGFGPEIVDLALYPSGALAVLAEDLTNGNYFIFGRGRFDLSRETFEWMNWDILGISGSLHPGLGALIPTDELHTAMLLVQTNSFSPVGDHDRVELFFYEADYFLSHHIIDVQLAATDLTRRPRGVLLPGGEIAMSFPGARDGSSGYVAWLDSVQFLPFAAEVVPGGPRVVALGPDELVVASHAAVSPQQVLLEVSSLPRAQAPTWSYAAEVPTTSASEPDLAVDRHGSAVIALRTTAGTAEDPRDAAVQLTRLAADGTEVWSTSVPLAVEHSQRPIALQLTDDDGLLLAGIVGDRLHLERREQGCRCD